jgi:hypothetical protein
MTTLCIADLATPRDNVVPLDARARNKVAAGAAAHQRALRLGFCRTSADAFRRVAHREWLTGETPEQTAHRIVRLPHSSATHPDSPGAA